MPEPIVEIARAKINLALHVLGRRHDGYHELDSIVAFADFGDRLTLRESQETRFEVVGPFANDIPSGADNLVLRVHTLMSAKINCPPVAFTLEKNLPAASGVGGGSADAAATLRGLVKLARNEVVPSFIDEIALQLGADVPVCFMGKAVRMQGVGEVLTELAEPPGGAVVLVNPLLQCATASVFRMLGLKNGQQHQSALDLAHPDLWRNDLTDAAIAVVPSIADVLRAMQSVNELNVVRMSGSGATCFGLANDLASATRAARCLRGQYPDWWIVSAALS